MEISDSNQARQFLLETWGLARADRLTAASLHETLQVALELASEGQPHHHVGFHQRPAHHAPWRASLPVPEGHAPWSAPQTDASLARRYEDYVLGKLAADMSLDRAHDELQKFKAESEFAAWRSPSSKCTARQLARGADWPAVIKSLLALSPKALQPLFYEATSSGLSAKTRLQWEELIQAVRNSGELLGARGQFRTGQALP